MALDGYATKPKYKIGEIVLFEDIVFIIQLRTWKRTWQRKWTREFNSWVYWVKSYNSLDQDIRFKLYKYKDCDKNFEWYAFGESNLEKLTDEKKLELL